MDGLNTAFASEKRGEGRWRDCAVQMLRADMNEIEMEKISVKLCEGVRKIAMEKK